MKIAITGGTGFVGRHLAQRLIAHGHTVVLIARGLDRRDEKIRNFPGIAFAPIGIDDEEKLTEAFAGCIGVAHCAGINREIGSQTYARVHVDGTRHVVRAAERAGVQRLSFLSFLRARPDCGSVYHESKWAAEEIVRASALDYTVLKAGVIYGSGDHMLDHLSRAFYTFPVFALVGFKDPRIRPAAVEDVARILEAALVDGRLSRKTVAVLGPEDLTLKEAVRRVAETVGRAPWMFPMPIFFHAGLAYLFEKGMKVPLLARAQLRILSEGIVEPLPYAESLPPDLQPVIRFSKDQIAKGLPAPAPFRWGDLRA